MKLRYLKYLNLIQRIMRKAIEIKDVFSRSLRACLHKHYGKVPTASIIARDFNLRAYDIEPITQESARRWIRGLSIPEEDRLKVLIEWLKLDFNDVLCSHHVGDKSHHIGNSPLIHQKIQNDDQDDLSDDKEEQMKLFLNLPDDKKKLILELIKLMIH